MNMIILLCLISLNAKIHKTFKVQNMTMADVMFTKLFFILTHIKLESSCEYRLTHVKNKAYMKWQP